MQGEMVEFAHLRDSVSGQPLRLEHPPGYSAEKSAAIRKMGYESGKRLKELFGAPQGDA